MFLYVPFIYYLNIWKDVLFFQLNKKFANKKGLVVETSLDSIYILPYYFFLSSCYLQLLSNQNQSVYLFPFHIPINFLINKEKNVCQWWFVCVVCHTWKYFFQDGTFQCSMAAPKNFSCRQPWC